MQDSEHKTAWSAIVAQFCRREASPAIQFVKYAICGGAAVFVNTLVFYLLAWLVLPALAPADPVARLAGLTLQPLDDAVRANRAVIDNGIAFLFSNLTAYLLNIYWVFEPGRHHKIVEVLLFYLVSATSFAIGTALMWVLIHHLGFSTTVAFVAQVVVAALINFAARKYFIFKG